jgi:hypothetical protein
MYTTGIGLSWKTLSKVFAECSTRQRELSELYIISAMASLSSTFYRALDKDFAECHSVLGKEKWCLPSVYLCREPANAVVTERRTLPSAALGKDFYAECPIKSTRQSA